MTTIIITFITICFLKSSAKKKLNPPTMYICVPWSMEWKFNTGRIKVFPGIVGTPWDFQEPFCFYPWEPGSAPLNPPLRTQRQRRGMLNVNGQTAPAPSERERWRYKAWPLSTQLFCYEGQKWNCTHTAKGVHLHKLQKIITCWPWSLNNGKACTKECVKTRWEMCQNK